MFPQFFCHLQFYLLIFLCYIVNDIANIMMEYLTYLITILIVFETSLSEVILYLCLIWSHIKLQYLSTYQRWYLCLKKQICNEFKKMNDTFKIKKHVSTVFLSSSVLCAHISLLCRGWYCQKIWIEADM